MPRAVKTSLAEFSRLWVELGVRAWEQSWWQMSGELGNLLGAIIGAADNSVSIHQNVTTAQAVICSAVPPSPRRNRVVYSELNFPSVRYLYQAQPELEVKVVPCPDRISVPLDALVDAIDERTLLVPISHVIFRSGAIVDPRPVIEKAHQVGARVVLDAYQSCGTVPLNVTDLGVDFAVGGSVKWLCGSPGVAYLYVRPDLTRTLRPQLTGWMAHSRPFAFEAEMDYCSSSYRFLNGTPNIPGMYTARPGYEMIREIGVDRIRRRSISLTRRIVELALGAGFEINSPLAEEQRGGAVTVNPPGAAGVCRQLLERNIVVDFRPDAGIRVAPHFYNSLDEIDEAMAEMRRIVNGQNL